MKSIKLILILLLIYSCQKEDEYSGIYTIKGKIEYDNGQIARNSQIFLDNELKTTTNNEGDFTLNAVLAGKYKLKATNSDSSGYSEVEVDIDLKDSDLDLESLLLLPAATNIGFAEISFASGIQLLL